jgi:hypothetical protein
VRGRDCVDYGGPGFGLDLEAVSRDDIGAVVAPMSGGVMFAAGGDVVIGESDGERETE